MSKQLLLMKGINKDFSGVQVLKDVNLSVQTGEIHAICGENGAGKSTLMKILSGVYPAGQFTGEINFDGEKRKFSSIRDSEAAGIVIIHQELALIPDLSIGENIFLGAQMTGRGGLINWHELNKKAEEAINRVGLYEKPTEYIRNLGVGKQQLVEIAKALVKNARLLILDEPTAALNDEESAALLNLIRELRDGGVTIVIISHKLGEIQEIADRTTILRDGSTIETLDMSDPASTTDKIISLMVGRSLENQYPKRESVLGSEALRVEGWTVAHPSQADRIILDNVSLNVKHGEVVGLAGLMGAGRTEFAMSLFGKSYGRYKKGEIYLDGKAKRIDSPQDAIKCGIAYASEDRKGNGLNVIAPIKHNITLPNLAEITEKGLINLERENRVADDYRSAMHIRTSSVELPVSSLSGGNQQKVVLAKWLFTHPDVLILDEPTRGIDIGAKYDIYSLINDMVAAGKAVIVISSELEELLGVTDRIFVMAYGRITGELKTACATQESVMELMTKELEVDV